MRVNTGELYWTTQIIGYCRYGFFWKLLIEAELTIFGPMYSVLDIETECATFLLSGHYKLLLMVRRMPSCDWPSRPKELKSANHIVNCLRSHKKHAIPEALVQ